MKLNKQSFPLIIILTVIVLIIETVTLSILYSESFEQQRAQLIITTQSQARLIESVARFDKKYSKEDIEGGASAATFSQLRDAHMNNQGFGQTGEFLFGKKENDKIIFLLPRRFKGIEEDKGQNKLLDIGGSYAEPIQLALAGKSGTIIAKDYRGEKVLAAYEPVKDLNYGVVTKIDIKELRAPFIRVGLISLAIAGLLIAIGSFLFLRITNPMIKGIEGSASRLNEAQRLAKVGSWELNLTSGALIWSDEIFNIFEIDKAKFEATYEAFLNAIHPDDRDEVNQAYSKSLADRKPYEISHRLKMSNGTIKYVHETCESYFDHDGKPIRSVGTVQDITIQKQLESNIDKNRARFEAMFESMPDSVIMTDLDRNVSQVNKAVEKLFGYTESELVGKDTSLLYANHDAFLNAGKQRYSIDAEGDPLPYEVEYRKKDGSVFCGETLGTKIISADGELYGFFGIIRDITERKNTELELDQYAHQLESKVDERTKELRDTQNELVRKERLATLGQLTATVSHELRNPLGAMRPSMFVIEKSSDKNDERVQKAIERVDRNIDRCDNIIDELLDFTRITELNLRPVRVDEWLNSVIDEQIIPEGLHIEKDFSLKELELNIDTDRLRRAVINVFENGCHSMMDDSKQLVSTERTKISIDTHINDVRVEIIVSDVGSGISKEVLNKIYEPLFSTKGFGVGLGMPTVKQIMEQHGGGIEINSEKSKGTQVTLWLPLNTSGIDGLLKNDK